MIADRPAIVDSQNWTVGRFTLTIAVNIDLPAIYIREKWTIFSGDDSSQGVTIMKIQIRWGIIVVIWLVGWTVASRNSYAGDAPKATTEDDLPVLVSLLVTDGTPEGLVAKDKQLHAVQDLGETVTRSAIVTINLDALDADFRDKSEPYNWQIGSKVTLELFDDQSVVVENTTVREYDDSWSWVGRIVDGGSGRVRLFVSADGKSVDGEIRLASENRRLFIRPVDASDMHLLYEFAKPTQQEYRSDMVQKVGDRLTDLQMTRERLEAELALPGKSQEFRDGVQFVLDGIIKQINEEKAKRSGNSEQSDPISKSQEADSDVSSANSQSLTIPVVKVLVLNGSYVSNPQAQFDAVVDELEELFYENSDVDVVFSFATSNPLTIGIPGELAISAETILAGVANGIYVSSPEATPTTTLRNIYVADLVVTIYNNSANPADCGSAYVGTLPADDTTGFAVAGSVCASSTAVWRGHEIGHNFGAGHEAEPGLYSDSRAFVVGGLYQTIMASGLAQYTSLPYFSQQDPQPPGVLYSIGDDGHENLRAVNDLAPTVEAYRVPSPSPPGTPDFLHITPEFCHGWNIGIWGTVSAANYYELRRSTTIGGFKWLTYSGPLSFVKFSVPSTSYMWVRACNDQGCGGYRQGNRQAKYFPSCN